MHSLNEINRQNADRTGETVKAIRARGNFAVVERHGLHSVKVHEEPTQLQAHQRAALIEQVPGNSAFTYWPTHERTTAEKAAALASAYGGHHPEHLGLQRHSVGGQYPWGVRGIGNGERTDYEAWHATTGEHSPRYPTAEHAQAALDWHLLTGNWLNPEDAQRRTQPEALAA